jgi:hypothetical protein
MTSRRNFLKATALGGLGIAASSAAPSSGARAAEPSSPFNRGPSAGLGVSARILALGNLASFSPEIGTPDALTVIDLKDGGWTVFPSKTKGGHLAAPLAGGVISMPRYDGVIEIRDRDFNSWKTIESDEWAFSGHCVENGKEILLAAERTSGDHRGELVRVSASSGEILGSVESGGVHPHDMAAIDGGSIAVSHYGLPWSKQVGEGGKGARLMFEDPAPSLSVIDTGSLKIDRKFTMPAGMAATHIAVGTDGRVWVQPLQYRLFDDVATLSSGVRPGTIARQDEWKSKSLADGLPMLAVDPENGKIKEYDLGDRLQRRGQSVAASREAKRIFAAFPHSDTLWWHDETTGHTGAVRAFDLGIQAIRGVAAIPGTDLIAINGEWEGVVVLDARSLKIAGRYAVPTFWTVHLSAQTY